MRALPIVLGLLGISIVGYAFFHKTEVSAPHSIVPTETLLLADKPLRVAVADTDALRAQGLSGSAPLADDEGMLFIFDEDGVYPFWMKDMLYSIDIFWLDATGSVVHIEKNLSPDTYPQSFTPHSPARYVLEVRAGFADQHDIQIGTRANLPE
ncbi:DUF192 domain-containing protein [bacterium]|nr:DUF192 domain-containing protein [bacterium]